MGTIETTITAIIALVIGKIGGYCLRKYMSDQKIRKIVDAIRQVASLFDNEIVKVALSEIAWYIENGKEDKIADIVEDLKVRTKK